MKRPHPEAEARGQSRNGTTAFVTIVSANYLAAARVLCRSLAEHHPGIPRFVVVVDRPVPSGSDEPFTLVPIDAVGVPDLEDCLAQYTIMEANTAVKPFVLQHLLEQFERVVYLDPDIWVLSPLDTVLHALDEASLVLTPHLREPFGDGERPGESDILRAGTFNLGFVAVKRSPGVSRLLSWWGSKTEVDCVVAPDEGLFVDQRWMDLAPGFVADTVLLHDPGYNVAYWNLHEREVTERSGTWLSGGRPLAFFHFSGYDPDQPARLSKHQTRHSLASMPLLRRLADNYGRLLEAEGHEEWRKRPYGYDTLANGVPLSPLLRASVRRFRKKGVPYPPVSDADAFCRFVMTPNARAVGRNVAPFVDELLARRQDVSSAFPGARDDAWHGGFLEWLGAGAWELDAVELHARFGKHLTELDPFTRIRHLYNSRNDLMAAFPAAFRSPEGLEALGNWLVRHGTAEEGLSPGDVHEFLDAGRQGFRRVVDFYLTEPHLHARFPLALLPGSDDFSGWLMEHGLRDGSLTVSDIAWFGLRRDAADASQMLLLSALRSTYLDVRFPLGGTVLGWGELCRFARENAGRQGRVLPPLALHLPHLVPPLSQLEAIAVTPQYRSVARTPFRSRPELRELLDLVIARENESLTVPDRRGFEAAVRDYEPHRGVNLAGHFGYAAGVGSAGLATARALDAAQIPHHDVTLPVAPSRMAFAEGSPGALPERYFGQHRPDFELAVTVANADVMAAARSFLGPRYADGRRHVACWVWETDVFPGKHAQAAAGLDAIWTPSKHSRDAIRGTLGPAVPVHVVPYAVPVRRVTDPRPLPLSLPHDRTLFGFFFDARSIIERKNPAALLRAFRRAFRGDDRVSLVLKVSHGAACPSAMRELERLADGFPVIWLRDVLLDEHQTRGLLARLDVYASLHRAEGFGLVLAEAMAEGTAVLATGYSGNLDFMDEGSAALVRHTAVVTDRSHGPYPRGTRWAEPDLEHAEELLRSLHLSKELRAELGTKGRARVEQLLAPWVVGKTMKHLLFGGEPGGGTGARPTESGAREKASESHAVSLALSKHALPAE